MAFDVGHCPYEPMRLPPERKTLEDHLDFVLRAIVILPLLGLYSWWVFTILRDIAVALIARITG